MTLKLGMQHWCSSTIKFVPMMTLGWPWPNLRQGQIWFLMLLCGKKVKQWIFSETIVVYYIKVGRCSQLNNNMQLYEYQRSRLFIDLGPNHSDSGFLNFFFSITADFNISAALRWAIQDQWFLHCFYLKHTYMWYPSPGEKSWHVKFTSWLLRMWKMYRKAALPQLLSKKYLENLIKHMLCYRRLKLKEA